MNCVAVNLGLPHILLNYFRAILGQRRVLPHIGVSNNEQNTRYQLERKADFQTAVRVPAPRDVARAKYALELCDCAFHFIFLHEFAHLFHGHVEWQKRNRGASPIQQQVLEFDADAFAGTDLLGSVLGLKYDADPTKPPRVPNAFRFGTTRHALFTAMFAVYSVFRIYSDKVLNEGAVYGARHPPMVYRQRFFLGGLMEMIYEERLISMPEFADLAVQAIVQAEMAYSLLTGSSLVDAPQIVEGFEREHELLNRLWATWEELMPELELLKQGGDLLPANWDERNKPFAHR